MFNQENGLKCHWPSKSIAGPHFLLYNTESLLLTGNIKQLTLLTPHSYRVQSHAECANETPIIIFDCQTGPRPVEQK